MIVKVKTVAHLLDARYKWTEGLLGSQWKDFSKACVINLGGLVDVLVEKANERGSRKWTSGTPRRRLDVCRPIASVTQSFPGFELRYCVLKSFSDSPGIIE